MRHSYSPRMFSSGTRQRSRGRAARAIAITTALTLSMLGIGITTAWAASHSVSLKNLSYNPAELNVAVGDTVVWSNDDSVTHSVTGGPLNSPDLTPGAKYTFTFTAPGTVDYHCRFHPDMQGK